MRWKASARIPSLLHQLEHGGWQGGQLSLFSWMRATRKTGTWRKKWRHRRKSWGRVSSLTRWSWQRRKSPQQAHSPPWKRLPRLEQHVRVAGMRQIWRRSLTTRGDYIYFMSLEDLEGMLDVVITAEVYRRSKAALATAGPYVVEGLVDLDNQRGEPFIRAEKIWTLK